MWQQLYFVVYEPVNERKETPRSSKRVIGLR